MYTLIQYPTGIVLEALVLAKGRNRLRLVVSGLADAIDVKRIGGQWYAPDGQAVQFEFIRSDEPTKEKGAAPRRNGATRAAGSSTPE